MPPIWVAPERMRSHQLSVDVRREPLERCDELVARRVGLLGRDLALVEQRLVLPVGVVDRRARRLDVDPDRVARHLRDLRAAGEESGSESGGEDERKDHDSAHGLRVAAPPDGLLRPISPGMNGAPKRATSGGNMTIGAARGSGAAGRRIQLRHHLVDRERRRLLPRGELHETLQHPRDITPAPARTGRCGRAPSPSRCST